MVFASFQAFSEDCNKKNYKTFIFSGKISTLIFKTG